METADRPRLTAGVDPTALPNSLPSRPSHRPAGPVVPRGRTAARRVRAERAPAPRERRWPRELVEQFTHPLALLLWVAARARARRGHARPRRGAIVAVIILNAAFAFVQERQAERAVEALEQLPARCRHGRAGRQARRDRGEASSCPATSAHRGGRADLRRRPAARGLARGRHVHADGRVACRCSRSGVAERARDEPAAAGARPRLQRDDLHGRRGRALVFATGMQTELGRIAALSERVEREESPLERQVRRVAWLIAAVAVAVGIAFIPLGMLGAGLPLRATRSCSRSACSSRTCRRAAADDHACARGRRRERWRAAGRSSSG